MRNRVGSWVALLATLFSLIGCRSGRTELVVIVESDIRTAPSGPLRSLRLTVRSEGPSGPVQLDNRVVAIGDGSNGTQTLPLSFGVIPRNNDSSRRVWVEVAACDTDTCDAHASPVVVARLLTGFVPEQTRELHLRLTRACAWVDCGDPSRTCDSEAHYCVDATVDMNSLPLRDAGVDAAPRIVQLAAAGGANCVLRSDGTVAFWGGANPTFDFDRFPGVTPALSRGVRVAGIENATTVAMGPQHACGVVDGRVRCQGSNANGQLGDGTTEPRRGLVDVVGPTDVDRIALGTATSCAVTARGEVWCWGSRLAFPPENNRFDDAPTPYMMEGVGHAIDVSVSGVSICAVLIDGTARCWGGGLTGEIGDGSLVSRATPTNVALANIAEIASTDGSSCARTRNGEVWCWGFGAWGQRGDGTTAETNGTPRRVDGLSAPVVQLTGGRDHMCARTREGLVQCWGRNDSGQLGDGSRIDRSTPVTVLASEGASEALRDVAEIAAGAEHTCARRRDGSVQCWGGDGSGQIASGRNLAQTQPNDVSVDIAGCTDHASCLSSAGGRTCALGEEGTVCWGLEGLGTRLTPDNFRDGHRSVYSSPHPAPALPSGVAEVSNGFRHACARLVDGHVYCWGNNELGQLGNGTREDSETPVPVRGIENATRVSAGFFHTCAVLADHTIQCWGLGADGRGGHFSPELCAGFPCDLVPRAVNGIANATDISVGEVHGCAILEGGTVACWGGNNSGVRGTLGTQPIVPTIVPTLHDIVQLSAGGDANCAVTRSGEVYCWGEDSTGQLGSGQLNAPVCGGNAECSLVPLAVRGLSRNPVVEVHVGVRHACAMTDHGELYCWGADDLGQLGRIPVLANGALAPGLEVCQFGICSRRAIQVTRDMQPLHVAKFVAGGLHTCALLSEGGVVCFGDTSSGQFDRTGSPDPDPTYSATPMPIHGLDRTSSLSASFLNTCAVDASGTVDCWGDAFGGQLGTANPANPRVPTDVSDVSNATGIAAGAHHSCAIDAGGAVSCWGDNRFGQLGDGTTNPHSTAAPVPGLDRVVQLCTGTGHTCARRDSGEVFCWGSNRLGQVGNMAADLGPFVTQPAAVFGVNDAVDLACTVNFTCVVRRDGRVSCWGDNQYGQLGDDTFMVRNAPVDVHGVSDATHVTATLADGCALRANGTVACWGNNSRGQLGNGTTMDTPHAVPVAGLTDVLELHGHSVTTCARNRDGQLLCWGANTRNIVNPIGGDALLPVPVTAVPTGSFDTFSLGDDFACIVTTGRRVQCWGGEFYAQLGIPVSFGQHPALVEAAGLHDVVEVSASSAHACARTDTGRVSCWGSNESGQLGHAQGVASTSPVRIGSLAQATSIATGGAHACVLFDDSSVRCWGENGFGQLALGDYTPHTEANEVPLLRTVTRLAAGQDHTCAVLSNGSVRCWGRSDRAQLGFQAVGIPDPRTVAVPRALTIAAGALHTCVIGNDDGQVYCWGSNEFGQLGVDAGHETCGSFCNSFEGCPGFPCSSAAAAVALPGRASEITAGGGHTCALLIDGTVWCWGANGHGQLGDGTTTTGFVPRRVDLPSSATHIAAGRDIRCALNARFAPNCNPSGEDHTCATTSDGHLWCWGRNDFGQLGDGTTDDRLVPTQASGVSDVREIALGGAHTCVRGGDGHVRCWGDDSFGQNGIASPAWRSAPAASHVPP